MACDTPVFVKVKGRLEDVPVSCGKCPPCKLRRVNSWVFRLQQEEKVSTSAYFVTLTYNHFHVPITNNGFMTVSRRDFQLFMKRLRKLSNNKLRYYVAAEYGDSSWRPHYHMILFNLEGVRKLPDGTFQSDLIEKAWSRVSDFDVVMIADTDELLRASSMGLIHIGTVTSESIAYTAKYIDKPKRIPVHGRDDRTPEFSFMSKGLGSNFITSDMKKYYTDDLSRNFIIKEGGHKIAIPKYYRDKMLDDDQKEIARNLIARNLKQLDYDDRVEFDRKNPDEDYDLHLRLQKNARFTRFYSKLNKIRKL